ncbi:MAG: protein-L-isoaspartate O-methyltransferase family protein, partial [Gemmatimonadota bacterium]
MRNEMVRRQIEGRGVRDPAVLRAMRTVPRHRFVPGELRGVAYRDGPLPIGHGQTISQPYIVAFMAEAARVEPGDRVLEIGTGSGYGAAVLAELAGEVYTIEIVPELAERARETLTATGYGNVHVRTGNGWLGWPEHAPFDAIVVT